MESKIYFTSVKYRGNIFLGQVSKLESYKSSCEHIFREQVYNQLISELQPCHCKKICKPTTFRLQLYGASSGEEEGQMSGRHTTFTDASRENNSFSVT